MSIFNTLFTILLYLNLSFALKLNMYNYLDVSIPFVVRPWVYDIFNGNQVIEDLQKNHDKYEDP